MITLTVYGTPQPQGSKKAISARGGGRAMMVESGGAKHAAWRNAIAAAAADQAAIHGQQTGPLHVDVHYQFAMPASRPKAIRKDGEAWKTTAPDIDKLDRAVYDGLQAGGLIANDAHIVVGWHSKVEVLNSWTGCVIAIKPAGIGRDDQ